MAKYSERVKQSMAAKILMPGGPNALSLASQTGISQTSLLKWARDFKNKVRIPVDDIQRRPKDWSKADRFQAILDCDKLQANELGEFLRKKGLTTAHLDKWKNEFSSDDERNPVGRPSKSLMEKDLLKENKDLKREILRKDKALAEAAALLILKKKAQEIWGRPEDDE
jgi:transposase-like protein